jgi:Skp family chaperone for outer membrane proteins
MRPLAVLFALVLCLAVGPGASFSQEAAGGQGGDTPAADSAADAPADPPADPPIAEGQGTAVAPEAPRPLPPPVLTLDQDRLFKESAYGRAAVAQAEEDGKALAAENRRIEQALAKEEQDLTDRRATMDPAAFAAIAAEFDTKVEQIRTAQDSKSRAIARALDEARQKFFEAVTPVLGDLLAESGAAAILADSAIVMSLTSLDVTSLAIARMDAVLPAPSPALVPDSPPDPAQIPAPQATP